MRAKVINSVRESIQWFCEDEIEIGDPLYGNYNDPGPAAIARSFKNRKSGDKLLGVSSVYVVKIDLTIETMRTTNINNVVIVGNKIRILEDGEILMYRKYDKIPYGQPMYISKKGKITWRKHCEHIGWVSSRQDKDGFLKVRVEINERD
jgi:hypothetical protein